MEKYFHMALVIINIVVAFVNYIVGVMKSDAFNVSVGNFSLLVAYLIWDVCLRNK